MLTTTLHLKLGGLLLTTILQLKLGGLLTQLTKVKSPLLQGKGILDPPILQLRAEGKVGPPTPQLKVTAKIGTPSLLKEVIISLPTFLAKGIENPFFKIKRHKKSFRIDMQKVFRPHMMGLPTLASPSPHMMGLPTLASRLTETLLTNVQMVARPILFNTLTIHQTSNHKKVG